MTTSPWEIKPLSDVAEVRTGFAKNASVTVAQPVSVHYLRVANVQDGFLDLSDLSRIDVSRSDLQRFAVLPGDVLMNEGGDLDKLGRGALWSGEFHPCIHQNHVFVVRCGTEVRPAFLRMWSSGGASRRYFLVAGKQTTNLASISKTALSQLPVAVPPLNEQDAIAEALSDVDALLTGLDRLIAKKRDLKQAAMQQLLSGKTRLPGFFGDWKAAELKELCSMKSGESITSKHIDESATYPCYGGNGVRGFTARFTHEGSHVLIGRQGALCGNVVVAHGRFFASEHAVVVSARANVDVRWLSHVLRRMNLNQYSESSAQPGLSVSKILRLSVRCPPSYAEQSAIAAVLAEIDDELGALETRRAKTIALKQAMMQELLTGRIRLV